MNFPAPHFIRSIGRCAAGFQAARERIRAERTIREMPVHLRKDIGWPDAWPERRRR